MSKLNYHDFVDQTLRSLENHVTYGHLCKYALTNMSWNQIVGPNDYSEYKSGSIYLHIYREYNMSTKLLRAPKDASILYIIHLFNGNLPPRPKNTSILYQIDTLNLHTFYSNALMYLWQKKGNLPGSMTTGNTDDVKKMVQKGYDLKDAETYDLNDYVYDKGLIPNEMIMKYLSDQEAIEKIANESSFYRFVLKTLTDFEESDRCTSEMSGAIHKAIENYSQWANHTEYDDASCYTNGSSCVYIECKVTLPATLDLDIKLDNLLVIIGDVCCFNVQNKEQLNEKISEYISKFAGKTITTNIRNLRVEKATSW